MEGGIPRIEDSRLTRRYDAVMTAARVRKLSELCLLLLIGACILWKGGKAVDATWIALATACVLTLVGYPGRTAARMPPILWWSGALFMGWTIVSYIASQTRNYGLDEVFRTAALLLTSAWTIRYAYGEGRASLLHHVARTLAFVTLVACAIGTVVYILQPVNRFVGTFFDYRFHTDYWPNAWAEFVLLAWPLLAAVLWAAKLRRVRLKPLPYDIAAGLTTGLCLSALLLSFSRGAAIAFAGQIALAVILLLCGAFGRVEWMRLVRSSVVCAATSVLLFIGINSIRSQLYPVESVIAKVTLSSAEGTSSVSERSQFWQQAIAMAGEKPVFGWGPYSFRFVQPSMQTGVLATSDHPHNVILKLAAERGVPAASLLALIIAYVLYIPLAGATYREASHKNIPADTLLSQRLKMTIVISIAGVLAHNMIDYNLQFLGIALPMAVFAGLLVAEGHRKTASDTFMHRSGEVFAVAMLSLCIVEGGWLLTSSLGRHAQRHGYISTALAWYERSRYELFSRDMLLSQAQLYLDAGRLQEAANTLEIYTGKNVIDYRGWKLHGDLASRSGDAPNALAAYDIANVSAKFNDLNVTLSTIDALLQSEQMDLLNERLPFIQRQMNEFALAIEQNTHFVALSQNVETLIALCETLSQVYPDDARQYEGLAKRIQEKATGERLTFSSRPEGFLWRSVR